MTRALTLLSFLSYLALCAAFGCSSGSDGANDGGDASTAGTSDASSAGSGGHPTAGTEGGAGGKSGTDSGGGASGAGTSGAGTSGAGTGGAGTGGAGDGGTSDAGGDATVNVTDGGGVDAGPIGECAGSNVCTAEYPCQNLAPDYTCRGQYADWTPSDSPATFTVNGDGTVTDSRSGLVWQQAVDDDRKTWANAKSYCMGLSLAGGGWRLPTKAELESIVDFGKVDPTIDETAFPDLRAAHFWSSSAYVGSSGDAWYVNFIGGTSYYDVASVENRVRCVRSNATVTPSTGGGGAPPTRYTLSDDTVEDNRTGLIWQREVAASVYYEQPAAITHCGDLELGGFDDWRLPAVSELLTLVDPTSSAPAIDETAFPNTPSDWTWSSSAYAGVGGWPDSVWGVDFDEGQSFVNTASFAAYVRCVR